ncbi:bifunctional 4-hydroxy-2-oxoglutarate aldolase/2-dehydro-3-deoxy-phosphogluconate aldolase [Nocardioides zhouii]|uniref:Bifunctional 4-hydroxy-2-oxoglutarate aldolase/2-dehydro-3-deoxy-phosphogluconate aldolase n=1 Tax=Nocardioides zhouii TaxID=1168729 RepID=A0A4Q2SP86_9ACTN|nr:bifunctional 4-hydroxy-2-oxoglutarate aldolase/2-dehydro-3-deoxy-phosphogluconate aldolase [Nocardioides zhouii]RYC05929.1 bifunctional 4-hydroxy-2-oxoglutarate aldolase/2-dehydro-3-deoxy-phosphogluconate aldolase [Nocardioides zhouii]
MIDLRTIAILRDFGPERSRTYAERCWAAGMDLVEVPVQGEAGWSSLEAVADAAAGRAFGAGTVLSTDDAKHAIDLGASVLISPGTDPIILELAASRGVVALPGVMTPSDVSVAVQHGVGAVKLFPASVVGPAWISALSGPFPGVGVVAVGGIGIGNAADYLRAGAVGVGFGGSVVELLETEDPADVVAGLHGLIRPPR